MKPLFFTLFKNLLTRGFFKNAFILLLAGALFFVSCGRVTEKQKVNVVFTGDFADPTIVRDGDTFYMTHTSYAFLPGLQIWKSADLENWTPVCRALQTNVGEVWAPEFIKYNNLFYIYFPTSLGSNFVITAPRPEGPWSHPVKLDIDGIDPGHIATPDGKRFLYVNDGRMAPLSADGLRITDSVRKVYDGWDYPAEWAVECFCLESPKLVFRKGFYYLVSAEGGTSGPSTGHLCAVARSESPEGPWENSPYNPLVHTFTGDEPWISKGHGTLFDDSTGNWFVVYHAYKNGHRPLGRNTLIEKVNWTDDGWPMADGNRALPDGYKTFRNQKIESDDFSGEKLKPQWCFSGLDTISQFRLENGRLILRSAPQKVRALHAIAGDENYEATLKFETTGDAEAGLVVFYNSSVFSGLATKGGQVFSVLKGKKAWGTFDFTGCQFMKIKLLHYNLSMAYSADGKTWFNHHESFDLSGYHTNVLGGFSSLKIAVFCRGEGELRVDDFRYSVLP